MHAAVKSAEFETMVSHLRRRHVKGLSASFSAKYLAWYSFHIHGPLWKWGDLELNCDPIQKSITPLEVVVVPTSSRVFTQFYFYRIIIRFFQAQKIVIVCPFEPGGNKMTDIFVFSDSCASDPSVVPLDNSGRSIRLGSVAKSRQNARAYRFLTNSAVPNSVLNSSQRAQT